MNGWLSRAAGLLRGARLLAALAVGAGALHVALVFRNFPASSVLRASPLCSGDLSYHFAECFEGRQMLLDGLKLWAYSPFYMAGYPFGLWNNVAGSHGYMFAGLLLPGGSLGVVYYVYLVGTALLPPFLVALAAAVLGWGRRRVLGAFCAAALIYQADNLVSYLWTFGNVAFPFACALGVLYTALLLAAIDRCRMGYALAAGIVLGVVAFLHQLAILPVMVSSLLVLWSARRAVLSRWGWVYPLAAFTIALAIMLPWCLDLAAFSSIREARRVFGLSSGWKSLVMDFFSDRAYRHPFDRRALFHVEVVLVLLAWLWARRGGGDRATGVFAGSAFALLFCAYAFAFSSVLKQSEPYRFVGAFSLFGILPLARGAEEWGQAIRRSKPAGRALAAALGLILLPSLTGYAFDILGREPACGLAADSRAVVRYLRAQAPVGGRVLCEDEELGNMLPALTGREVIGGQLSVTAYLKHWRASAGHRFLFGRDPAQVTVEQLGGYLALYDVTWAVANSPSLIEKLGRVPGCVEAFRSERYRVFAVDPRAAGPGLPAAGGAVVRAEARPDSLRVVSAPAGRFVLSYHFLETLSAPPGVRLFPYLDPRDPVPFIGVDNDAGLAEVTIRNRR